MKGQPNNAQASSGGAQPAWMGMASHYVPQSPVFAATGNPAIAGGAPTGGPAALGLVGGAGGNMAPGVSTLMGGVPNAAGGAFSTPGVMANNTMGTMPAQNGMQGNPMVQNGMQGNPAIHNFLSQLPPGLLGALGGGGGGGMPSWLSGLLGSGAGGMAGGMAGGNMAPMAGGMAGGNMAPPTMNAPAPAGTAYSAGGFRLPMGTY
jgi:hypothetical protein